MSTVIYVAIVEGSQDEGYSAFFPDLPGCVTAAETMLELPAAAREALALHLQGMLEDGLMFPEPTPVEAVKVDSDVHEVARLIVDADVEDAPVRVNISIGSQFLKRLDVAAEARGMTRSGFLVEAARAYIETREANNDVMTACIRQRFEEALVQIEAKQAIAQSLMQSAHTKPLWADQVGRFFERQGMPLRTSKDCCSRTT